MSDLQEIIDGLTRSLDALQDYADDANDEGEAWEDEATYEEARDAMQEVRDYIAAGRIDDALLTIERFLYPKHAGAPWRSAA